MFPIKILPKVLLFQLFILTACSLTGEVSGNPIQSTLFPPPTATVTRILPTPSLQGDAITWRELRVSMDQTEITGSFTNEFGSQRLPPSGRKFLWIHVILENVGTDEILLPEVENFSVLYAESEFKPIYGHRQDYADYTELGSTVFPEQKLDAWLRFDIPDSADLNNLWFVFLPTSAQVGVSPSSPNYPYADNKPTYVWKCVP